MLHHACDSSKINWVRYFPATRKLQISFKPKGAVYEYDNVPDHHFENTRTAKIRNKAIGGETPGSEGSYLIHHVIGMRGQPSPYPFRNLGEKKVLA